MLLIILGYPDTDEKQYFDANHSMLRGATLRGVRPISCLFVRTSFRELPYKEEMEDLIHQALLLSRHKHGTLMLCQCIKTQEFIQNSTGFKFDIVEAPQDNRDTLNKGNNYEH